MPQNGFSKPTIIPQLIALLVTAGNPQALAQTLVVTESQGMARSATLDFNTSIYFSGDNLQLPGPLNVRERSRLKDINNATIIISTAQGEQRLNGSISSAGDLTPKSVMRNANQAEQTKAMDPSKPLQITLSSTTPAVTALSSSESISIGTVLTLDAFTVFP